MIKIEAATLEEAYKDAAYSLKCSVTELKIEVAQIPSKGFLGLFKKNAIIVAMKEVKISTADEVKKTKDQEKKVKPKANPVKSENTDKKEEIKQKEEPKKEQKSKSQKKSEQKKEQSSKQIAQAKIKEKQKAQNVLNDTIMPASFVSTQDDEDEYDVSSYLADYDDDEENDFCEDAEGKGICDLVDTVSQEINTLFDLTCFKIDSIDVSVYDENTLLVEFKGEDAALLIGKEGYRYKALSYMIFNWINTKYQVQLRLEIAEFLKNQEESISKYLVGVCENIEKDGRAQTKILDGVLVQIALNELRAKYPDKYIVIRSTRDGLKYIIVNDYHSN